jgi:hypothetical protein
MSGPDSLAIVNNELENIYVSLSDLQGTQVNALTKQSSMMDMVNAENARLASKQDTIDQAALHQSRALYFNDNERKISAAYLMILVIIVATLGALFLIRIIFHHFGGYLPVMLFNILVIITISVGIILSFNQYVNIRRRDPYNFDELKLSTPSTVVPTSTSSTFNYGSIVGCIGSQCCTPPIADNPGTIWSPTLGKCINPRSIISATDPVETTEPNESPVGSPPPTLPVFTSISPISVVTIPPTIMSTVSPSPSPSIIPSISPIPSSTSTTKITSISNPTTKQGFTIMADGASEVDQYGFV